MVDFNSEKIQQFLSEGYTFAQYINTGQLLIEKTPERKKIDAEFYNAYRKHLDKRYEEIFGRLRE